MSVAAAASAKATTRSVEAASRCCKATCWQPHSRSRGTNEPQCSQLTPGAPAAAAFPALVHSQLHTPSSHIPSIPPSLTPHALSTPPPHTHLSGPDAKPRPIRLRPPLRVMVHTSAKSTLIRPTLCWRLGRYSTTYITRHTHKMLTHRMLRHTHTRGRQTER